MDRGLGADDAPAAEAEDLAISVPSWDPADAQNLLPQHLTLSKPLRAWERKPALPFARNRARAVKVWKRAPSVIARNLASHETRTGRRLRRGEGTQSPVKIIKRLRLGLDEGVGMSWEGVRSPAKKGKIVTRSARAAELVALEEEEGDGYGKEAVLEEAERDASFEVIYEEGALTKSSGMAAHDEEDWEDEDSANTPSRSMAEIIEEPSPVANILSSPVGLQDEESQSDINSEDDMSRVASTWDTQTPLHADHDMMNENDEFQDGTFVSRTLDCHKETAVDSSARADRGLLLPFSGPLPDGFLSPVRRHRPSSKRLVAAADRRRTLPESFTSDAVPVLSIRGAAGDDESKPAAGMDPRATELVKLSENAEIASAAASPDRIVRQVTNTNEVDSEWEDVYDEAGIVEERNGTDIGLNTALNEDFRSPLAQAVAIQEQLMGQLAAEEHNPRASFSPRRSPRQKSPSPGKPRQTAECTYASCSMALSPLKEAALLQDGSQHDANEKLVEDGEKGLSVPEPSILPPHGLTSLVEPSTDSVRSSSAPPESLRISPRRTGRPRVSDDTALLQAFIKRANQSKTPRRDSIAKRESLENRRESDTVRQALALSPAKEDVLADLDPNSSSPRKITAEDASYVADMPVSPTTGDDDGSSKHRRSGRDRRRTQRTPTVALPNKISLRGNAEPFVLRRDEAQELARATKSNTRKNKLGSVMPLLRLTRLVVEKSDVPADETTDAPEPTEAEDKRKGIRWDQTLVYYSDAPPPLSDDDEAEVQLASELADASSMADIATVPSIEEQAIKLQARSANVASTIAVPAAETPSKPRPRIRRLKAPRTAAAPGRISTSSGAIVGLNTAAAADTEPRSLKRSRIATPAKPTALPTPALIPEKQLTPPSAKPKLVPRKRAIPSRLPAPASLPNSAQPQELKSAGSLVSSPPKKKSSVTGAKAVTGGAPLPKLDFEKPAVILAARSEGEALGLSASPAKRMAGVLASRCEDEEVRGAAMNELGMGSPAKKRSRRPL